jgi:hypothetical protein
VPRPVRILLIVLLVAVAVIVLFTTVFPRVEQILEQDPTLDAPAAPAAPVPSATGAAATA